MPNGDSPGKEKLSNSQSWKAVDSLSKYGEKVSFSSRVWHIRNSLHLLSYCLFSNNGNKKKDGMTSDGEGKGLNGPLTEQTKENVPSKQSF